jgi:hypothetical protein
MGGVAGSDDCMTAFQQFDENGTGLIDANEFSHVLKDVLGLALTQPELNQLWKSIDSNGTGAINLVEFQSALFPKVELEDHLTKCGLAAATTESDNMAEQNCADIVSTTGKGKPKKMLGAPAALMQGLAPGPLVPSVRTPRAHDATPRATPRDGASRLPTRKDGGALNHAMSSALAAKSSGGAAANGAANAGRRWSGLLRPRVCTALASTRSAHSKPRSTLSSVLVQVEAVSLRTNEIAHRLASLEEIVPLVTAIHAAVTSSAPVAPRNSSPEARGSPQEPCINDLHA